MKFFVFAAICGTAAILAIWSAIGYGVNAAVDRVIIREAIDKAEHWGVYMADRIPDMEELVATGIPTLEQQRVIREVREVGDIFRFKLFTPDGRLSLISDDWNIPGSIDVANTADPEAIQVIATGMPIVEVFDGSDKPGRPDLYAEAYVPLIGPNGRVRGIVEVYVDQTMTRSYFVDSFRNFGLLLMAFFAFVFAVPGIAFCLQRMFAQRSRRDAEFLACFDPLTGLLNRGEFVRQSESLIAVDDVSVVCYLDVDRFKTVNDKYGHAVGDAFLAHVSQIIRKSCRTEDVLARFGGDEFVIAFRNISLEDAVQRVRTMLKESTLEIDIQNNKLSGSISVGLALVDKSDTLERALSNADAALYHAKSAGRDNFAVYGDEMGEELRRRQVLEARLREATQDCDFEVHYQPLVDGLTCELIGYEALLRLSANDGTLIPPSTFIPLAEELGLIEEIGRWTIRTATQEMASFGSDKMLAINLSTAQFRSGELVNIVKDALYDAQFPATRLELEITESLLLEDSPLVEIQIDTLKEMGVAIAMDDFGTGFSSLSYLWKYGFDRLKIDRSFVAALDECPERSREIIDTVVMLGARLNMKITAEGVETVEQSQLLSALGCDVLQGYLFGKASPLSALQTQLESTASFKEKNLPSKTA